MIAAYVPDLMDRSRLAGVPGIEFVSSPAALASTSADTVVVDLSRAGVLDVLPSLAAGRIIGFGSHVDRDLLTAARAAGCTEVLTRSQLFGRVAEVLGR